MKLPAWKSKIKMIPPSGWAIISENLTGFIQFLVTSQVFSLYFMWYTFPVRHIQF